MTFLLVLTGIIIFFALILNIRAHIHAEYEKELVVWAKWAFLKIPLLPAPEREKKPKKEKPAKEETPKEEEDQNKPKGPNPLKNIYENEQLEGILDIFRKLLEILDKFGRRVIDSFVIDEMFLDVEVTRGDAAQTAEEYGKMCQKIFPLCGAVVANCNVKQYSVNVEPDYIANPGTRFAFSLEISLNPRKLINAVLLFAFAAIFRLGIRLIKDLKPKNPPAKEESTVPSTENNPDDPSTWPVNQKKFPKYEEGSVHEPEIEIINNSESGAQ